MLTCEQIDTTQRTQVKRFVAIPYRLYAKHPQWVPPPFMDSELQLNRRKHPFYEHSDADFFVASRNGRDVGRLAVLENKPYNNYHHTHKAQFYLFECEDDMEAAEALFARAFEWARARGLNQMIGPKGFGALDGYGLLVEGFSHRQMMTMMNYNYEYYPGLVEAQGFKKEVDFVSHYVQCDAFQLPERIRHIAERVEARGKLRVHRFRSQRELFGWANRIGAAYNRAFVNNWEYAPLTDREIGQLVDNLKLIGDPRLIKVITHNDDVVGFLFAFPDVSAALQRARGRLFPIGIADILLELRRTDWVAVNGAGVLQEFQGSGGNAILYAEMEKAVRQTQFHHAEFTQVAETATQMRRDLENLGGKAYKNHRVYRREL